MSDLELLAHRVVAGSFAGPVAPSWAVERLGRGLGSVVLFRSNIETSPQVTELTASLRAAGQDVLIATDEEGGDVTRLHMRGGSWAPGSAALGSADDVELTAAVAAAIGSELAGVGVDLDLAPVVDVNSNPDNPVIGVRSFGAAPSLVARHTRAWVDGLQSAGVGACAKHFPGHGDTAIDSHVGLPTVAVPLEVLRARELVPFAAAVASGVAAVMTSHVVLQALDPSLPATLSSSVLRVLREELGFDGLLVSDALDMAGASAGRGMPDAAVLALAAGCDLLCLGADKTDDDVESVVAAIVSAVNAGSLPRARLVEAGDRVLATGRLVHGWRGAGAFPDVDEAAALDAARRAIRVAGVLPVFGSQADMAGAIPVLDAHTDLAGAIPVLDAHTDLAGSHLVLRFPTDTNAAVGQVPWGLPAAGSVLGGRHPVDVTGDTDLEEVMRKASSARAVVALVRDAHRHAWVIETLGRLAEVHRALVVVEMGWPGPHPLPGAATVWTYGASRANGAALDELLSGRAPTRSTGQGATTLAGRPPTLPTDGA